MITCYLRVALKCHEFDSRMVETDYLTNLHTNLFTSSAEEIQAQDLIAGTRDFLKKSFLVAIWI